MSVIPPFLQPGDTIAIVSPSRMITKDQLEKAWEIFDSWGLKVLKSPFLFERDGYFAGTDAQRLQEWEWVLSLQEVSAIFCARGGYGLTRIIDEIDLSMLQHQPKWLVGFSDVTAMHLALGKLNIASLHALMPVQYGYETVEASLTSIHDFLFAGSLDYSLPATALQTGEVIAPVTGGNLSLLVESLGTPTEIETSGKILFIEEIDEYLYKIDRMMNQLKRAGKLNGISGLLLGDFSDVKDTAIPFGKSLIDLIREYAGSNIPVAMNLPIGHENYNLALPLNIPVELKVEKDSTEIRLSHSHPRLES